MPTYMMWLTMGGSRSLTEREVMNQMQTSAKRVGTMLTQGSTPRLRGCTSRRWHPKPQLQRKAEQVRSKRLRECLIQAPVGTHQHIRTSLISSTTVMNKLTIVLEVLGKVFGFLKGLRCKMTSCCGCTSECGQKKSVENVDAESDEELAERQTTVQTSSLV